MVIISTTLVKSARKIHHCDASAWIRGGIGVRELVNECGLTFAEKRIIVERVQLMNGVIPVGSSYIRMFIRDGYDVYEYKAIPEVDAICQKYDLYEPW